MPVDIFYIDVQSNDTHYFYNDNRKKIASKYNNVILYERIKDEILKTINHTLQTHNIYFPINSNKRNIFTFSSISNIIIKKKRQLSIDWIK